MSSRTLNIIHKIDGVLTDFDSIPVLRDPTLAYGVKHDSDSAVVVAANTAFTHDATGLYSYAVTGLTEGDAYTAYVERVYLGETKRSPVTWVAGDGIALSDYALTTLAGVKRRLEITDSDSDDILSEYINQVSAEIERITGVKFKARDYRKWLDGNCQRELLLPHYPVQHVTRIAFGAAQALSVTFSGSAIRANASIYRDPESSDAGGMRLTSYSSTGIKTTTDLPFATYASVSAVATAVALISGWTATVLTNVPSADLHPTGGQDALGMSVTFCYPDFDDFAYSVNHDNGKVRIDNFANGAWPYWGNNGWGHGHHHDVRMPRAFQYILCEWRGGYETIPADVSLICNEIVADKYFEGQTGRGVSEIKLGPGTLKLDQSQIDDVREQLKHYVDLSNLIGEAY